MQQWENVASEDLTVLYTYPLTAGLCASVLPWSDADHTINLTQLLCTIR